MNWERIVWIKSQKADSLWRSSSASLHPICLLLPWKYLLPYLDESSIEAGVICGACACVYVNGYVHAWVHLYVCVWLSGNVFLCMLGFSVILRVSLTTLALLEEGLLIMWVAISVKFRSAALSCPITHLSLAVSVSLRVKLLAFCQSVRVWGMGRDPELII